MFVEGSTGVGKTTLVQSLLAQSNIKFCKVDVPDLSMDATSFLYHRRAMQNSVLVFQEAVRRAQSFDGVVVIDGCLFLSEGARSLVAGEMNNWTSEQEDEMVGEFERAQQCIKEVVDESDGLRLYNVFLTCSPEESFRRIHGAQSLESITILHDQINMLCLDNATIVYDTERMTTEECVDDCVQRLLKEKASS